MESQDESASGQGGQKPPPMLPANVAYDPALQHPRSVFQLRPIHRGYRGISEDEGKTSLMTANQLSPAAIDLNAYTPEFKRFLDKIEKA